MRLGSIEVAVTAALILVTINVIARLGDLPPRVMNVTCVLSFVFFTCSLLPQSILGFALTSGDWGVIYSRAMDRINVPTAAEFRRAAARSLVVLSTVVLFAGWGRSTGAMTMCASFCNPWRYWLAWKRVSSSAIW